MIIEKPSQGRSLKTENLTVDLVVVGGGLAGTCTAITAARQGLQTVLIQDRPVLGGNASSEVRLWSLGATSHMGNNNRWSREGGLVDEILVENMYRNKEGNPLIFDTVLLDRVRQEPNIRLLLNTAVYEVNKATPDTIAGVTAFCSQNSTRYVVEAPYFCDASGDGIVGFQAGAAFRMGAESSAEFGEQFTPDESYGELLGHTIYFYSKDVGKPVKYVAPDYALKNIEEIPRYRNVNVKEHGCKLWWIEYGG
ncbi:MAG TPA: FAD-binding dehydrogenase, partial [Opitutae bacterium]|nr:FAD-binding dehydrogenase [Opitutae bacterium]